MKELLGKKKNNECKTVLVFTTFAYNHLTIVLIQVKRYRLNGNIMKYSGIT